MAKDPYKYFRVEARELLDGLSTGIIELERSGPTKDLVGRLLRLAHTLKGAARVVKQKDVSELAHSIESLLEPYRDGTGTFPNQKSTELLALIDTCGELLKPLLSAPEPDQSHSAPAELPGQYSSVRIEITEVDTLLYEIADAGSHLGALYQEAASFERIEDRANALVSDIAMLSETDDVHARGPAAEEIRTLAEEFRDELKRTCRSFRAGVERARRNVGAIRDRAGDLRLLSVQSIVPVLERTARDAAESLRKNVSFEASGGEIRLDAHVLSALRDPLSHVVRNAVAHGIEREPTRAALGKPSQGKVRLQVQKKGRRIHFDVTDDGGGMDIVAIRHSLIAKGLITPGEASSVDLDKATQLLFAGGVSTAAEITEIMGRGIGLDVLRSAVDQLKGEIKFTSEAGRGTSVEIMVPISIEAIDALAVVAGESGVLIPFDSVIQTARLANEDLARSPNGIMFVSEGRALPFLPLAQILGTNPRRKSAPIRWTTVVVQARGQQAAIGVDRLNGVRHVVVRPLPVLTGSIPLVAGATLDGQGNPELVLDPVALVAAIRSKNGMLIEPVSVPPISVLVVDDSLTSRMLEQSILETAGYQVDLAICGEDALEMARRRRYAVFLIDVEMPGMNGFELVQKLQADPDLRRTPAILITSLASAEDRRRGQLAGAAAHIAKSEFEEGHLLRTIRSLVKDESQ